MPSRRQLLAALGGSGVVGLTAAATGTATVPELSPAWREWRAPVSRPNRELAGTGDRVFAVGDEVLSVLSRDDGSIVEQTELSSVTTYTNAGAVVGHGLCYTGDGALEAFTHSGEPRWTVSPDGERSMKSTPVVASDIVVAGFTDVVLGVGSDGERRWQTDVPGNPVDLAAAGAHVYVRTEPTATNREEGRLFALDRATGSVRWERERRPHGTGRMAAGSNVLVLPGEGVVALDADDGTVRWRRSDERVRSGTVDGETVVAAGGQTDYEPSSERKASSGVVRAFEAATGDPMWETSLRGLALWPPAPVADGYLVVDYGGHGLQALDPDGERRWWVSLNLPPKSGLGPLTHPLPGDPHVVGADDAIVGVAERRF